MISEISDRQILFIYRVRASSNTARSSEATKIVVLEAKATESGKLELK